MTPNYAKIMTQLEILEAEVRKLPREEALRLQDWLADFLEDQVPLAPEFIASIERGQSGVALN